MAIVPYLLFTGQAEEAMNLYARVFNGKIEAMSKFSDVPEHVTPGYENHVMHASLQAGDMTIMASDDGGKGGVDVGNNVQLSVNSKSIEEQDSQFGMLAESGTVLMPLEDTFWGARFGMVKDKFGVCWMFNYDHKK